MYLEICIIHNRGDKKLFQKILGNGSQLGIKIHFIEQKKPSGIPQGLILANKFIQNSKVVFILGDNVFYGNQLKIIKSLLQNFKNGSYIFCKKVSDPERFGIFFKDKKKIIEKPKNPTSNLAVTGLYFYDEKVIKYCKKLKKSKRGEYEITELNNLYLEEKKLKYFELNRSFTWLDAGTASSYYEISGLVKLYQEKYLTQIACLEEVALNMNFIDIKQYKKLITENKNKINKKYLTSILN